MRLKSYEKISLIRNDVPRSFQWIFRTLQKKIVLLRFFTAKKFCFTTSLDLNHWASKSIKKVIKRLSRNDKMIKCIYVQAAGGVVCMFKLQVTQHLFLSLPDFFNELYEFLRFRRNKLSCCFCKLWNGDWMTLTVERWTMKIFLIHNVHRYFNKKKLLSNVATQINAWWTFPSWHTCLFLNLSIIFNYFSRLFTQMYDILVVNKNYDAEGPDSISVRVGDLVEVLESGGTSTDEPNAK